MRVSRRESSGIVVPSPAGQKPIYLLAILALSLPVWAWGMPGASLIAHMVGFATIAFACLVVGQPHPIAPLGAFVVGFALYTLSFPLLVLLGYSEASEIIVAEGVWLMGFGLLAYSLGISSLSLGWRPLTRIRLADFRNTAPPTWLMISLVILAAVPMYFAVAEGLSKQGLRGSSIKTWVLFANILTLYCGMKYGALEAARKSSQALFFAGIAMAFMLAVFGSLGERDVVVALGFQIIAFRCLYLRPVSKLQFFSLMLLAAAVATLGQDWKSFISLDDSFRVDRGFDVVETILYGEFSSAGKNLYKIGSKYWDVRLGSELFLGDLGRVFTSSFFGIGSGVSGGEWFNKTLLQNDGSGKGFGLVAEGYLSFGVVGVMGAYFAMAVATFALYRISYLGVFSHFAYVNFMIVAIYSSRADAAFLMSFFLKTTVVPLLLLHVLKVFSNRGARLSAWAGMVSHRNPSHGR